MEWAVILKSFARDIIWIENFRFFDL